MATFTDLRNRRIPNWLVFPCLPAGIVVSGWLDGWHGIGPDQLFIALVITGLAGGFMALCRAAFGGFLQGLYTGAGDLVIGWKRRKMPYAPAVAIGTLISFFSR